MKMKRALTHDAGLGIGGRCSCGDGLPLQGGEGHSDGVKAELQLTHLAGGLAVPLVGFIRRANKLAELSSVV